MFAIFVNAKNELMSLPEGFLNIAVTTTNSSLGNI